MIDQLLGENQNDVNFDMESKDWRIVEGTL